MNSLQNIIDARKNSGYNAQAELDRADEVAKMYSDAINAQYAAGIQNLSNQKNNLVLEYAPERASVNAQYERGVRNNAEQMANLGLTRSGTNLTAQTALENERQRGIASVNAAQAKAAQDLQAQINEYIAQRDSAIAQQRAGAYENAYNNISSYQRQLAQMEAQHNYDKEMAAISHKYNQQMAALEHSYAIAQANNNFAQQREIEREMAVLEQSYKIQTLEKQAALDNESYTQRAATDWGYYQQQAALDSRLALEQYKAKSATDWDYYQQQAALDNQLALNQYRAKAATDWDYYQRQAALDNSGNAAYYSEMSTNEMEYTLDALKALGDNDSLSAFLDDLTAVGRISPYQADAYYAKYKK